MINTNRNWLLPEHVEDILPPLAYQTERIRRKILDLFNSYGYQYVVPPMIEFTDSLLTGSSSDMDLRLFKIVDQLSGKMMAIRADITPQAARIDAHLLNQKGVTRLCYAGSVIHTLPLGLMQTREMMQIGAELFGHAGLESDLEIQELMVKALNLVGIRNIHLDLGHVAIFRSLVKHAKITPEQEEILLRHLRHKDIPELTAYLETLALNETHKRAFAILPRLYGVGMEILDHAQQVLPHYAEIQKALADLREAATRLAPLVSSIRFDLGELRGYHYHSALVFFAYSVGSANPVAKGGRYDEVGKVFGRARTATGFSLDLRELMKLLPRRPAKDTILAPYYPEDEALQDLIRQLRLANQIVIVQLPQSELYPEELNIDRQIVRNAEGEWEVSTFNPI